MTLKKMFELERYLFVKNKTKIIEFQIYRKFVHIMKGGGGERKFIRNHIYFLRKLKIKTFKKEKENYIQISC